ncbi:peptidase domain-containing ABC transporter [Coleofasciculus sp. FACHB-SPT9]|uniref:peptidase domain-containing ABC transporter n=1 Tax=Cyanophyceae TaxID=3028117 RepID=UPI001F54A04F|nr:peptidase domain-containing ABC transporter [Coleofasciculus sp. FACHB-SPT9]
MNRMLVQGHPPLQDIQNAYSSLPDILNLLRLSQSDTSFASDLNQAFELCDFQLGDRLVNYSAATASGNSVRDEQNQGDFYLVCQGRVRLLALDAAQGKEVPALVVESGESFGAEKVFGNHCELTSAIAASAGIVARISIADLQPWLERLPNLQDYLQQQAIWRQCLIFFKTSTDWRRLSSHTLRQLLPYLVETRIEAGASLIESTPSEAGRFWLRSGQIESRQDADLPPAIGQSWGYPHPTPSSWIAQTDLVVYQLPEQHFEAARAIAPIAATFSEQSEAVAERSLENGHRESTEKGKLRHQPKNLSRPASLKGNRPPQIQSPQIHSEVQANIQPPESAPIAFPKPVKRPGRWFWQRYPLIEQQSSSDCGAACLAMIGQYWGKRFSITSLRNLAGVGRAGASLKNLGAAAEKVGFHAQPVRASLNRLVEGKNPWIAHWQGDHYVVVYRVKGDRILIADPAVGRRSLSQAEFLASWTGYALLLDPTPALHAAPTEKNSLNRFWGLLWPYRSAIGQIILASLLIQIFGLITPLFTQIILDRVVVHKSAIALHVFSLGLLLFGVWRVCVTGIRQYLLDYFGNRLDLTLIGGFISHTLTLPLAFFESRHVGDIITRVQENQKIQMFLTRQAVTAWLDASMAIVYLGLMFYYNWRLTLVVVALIPPIVILTVVASPFLRGVSRKIFNEEAGQNSSLVEMMTGIATVKAAAAERQLRWRWEDRLTSTLNAQFQGQKLANGLQVTGGLINTLGTTALLWYGATLVIQDRLTIGQFVAFNMMIGSVINPVLQLVNLWDELQEVLVSVERLNDVFSAQPEESPQKPLLVLPQLRGEVKLENVTFRYSPDQERNTLQNLSFEVTSGQTVAIVGRSGSGKSTLVNLLQGLYQPTSGRICVDGHDTRHVSPSSLRSQLGVVPQECFLFSGTILENITLYSDDFTLEQVVEVAKLAEAHAFIQDMPLGYHTKVGERGANLSGGQRQRIAIARALLGNPQIMILDEATSSLDTDSERRFQQNLARISRNRTIFIIAHRLSTVRHADCILVLDRGILIERGTHDELISLQGLYYHLAQQQLDL